MEQKLPHSLFAFSKEPTEEALGEQKLHPSMIKNLWKGISCSLFMNKINMTLTVTAILISLPCLEPDQQGSD